MPPLEECQFLHPKNPARAEEKKRTLGSARGGTASQEQKRERMDHGTVYHERVSGSQYVSHRSGDERIRAVGNGIDRVSAAGTFRRFPVFRVVSTVRLRLCGVIRQ